jgi:hypothetical protein
LSGGGSAARATANESAAAEKTNTLFMRFLGEGCPAKG